MHALKAVLGFSALQVFPAVFATPDCKCSPEDKCWPSNDAWRRLNSTLNGHLIQSKPPASVCYESEADYNITACGEILANWHLSTFHLLDPISISYPSWADNSCPPIFPNGTSIGGDPQAGAKGCTLGKYPSYVVNATGAEDIAAAVKWAGKRNVRLNVKNTGHSHLGRSTAYGSLSIWTHNIRGVDFHQDFQSQSCPSDSSTPQMAATIAAGEIDIDVYKALDEHNAVVVGGANPTVGLVGWFTGGGHGFLSSDYGMGSDNVLEATIVTMDGRVITTNACNHPDLFYAIRGGGGGTYGIITSVVMKAYPTPETTSWTLQAMLLDPSKEKEWWDLMADFHADLQRLKDGGLQGYYYMLGPPATESLVLGCYFMLFNKPNGTVEQLFQPLKSKWDAMIGTVGYLSNVATVPSFLDAYAGDPENEPVAQGGIALGSRLLPAKALEDVEAVSEAFQLIGPTLNPKRTTSSSLLIGHLIANSNNRDLQSALNPAWRDTVTHIVIAGGWPDGASKEVIQAIRDDITYNQVGALRKLAPDSGAYFNEMDAFEPNWQHAAFGKNYARLKGIKDKYDPKGVLWCRGCVGSESWVEDDAGKLCRADQCKRRRAV